jgi:hypothetical protein
VITQKESFMRRSTTLPRWILIPLVLSAAALLAALGLLLATEKRVAAAAPDYRVARSGGLAYEAMLGRPIHLRNPVDRKIVAGLGAGDRRPPRGQLLFGAFISATNDSSRTRRPADRIELRDDRGRVYLPLRLPATNRYAHRPRPLPARTRIPGRGTPADDNLAATGLLLLFRIPAFQYDNGTLELVIHDPLHPAHTTSLLI